MNSIGKSTRLYAALVISILANIVLLCFVIYCYSTGNSNVDAKGNELTGREQIEEKAKEKVKEYVCSNLYKPESYDPVEIRIDSAFYNYLTDYSCLKAAEELIDLRRDYHNAKFSYDEAVNNIKVFGGTGVFRHHTVERDNAKKNMDELKPQIDKRIEIIKNRNTSHDGVFVGWFVYNRYRAKANNDNIVFNEALLLFDKDMEEWKIHYAIGKDQNGNLDEVKKVIEEILEEEQ